MSIKIMTYVWKCAPVKGTELLMLLALADNANDDGICYPSVHYLAHKARINERNAQKTLKSLAKKKLITIQRNAGKGTIHGYTNRYIVAYSDGVSPETPVSQETPLGVSHKTPDGVSPETPKPSLEPSIEPSKRARKTPLPEKAEMVKLQGVWSADALAISETFASLTAAMVKPHEETYAKTVEQNRVEATLLVQHGITPDLLRQFYSETYTNGYTPSSLAEIRKKAGAWLAKHKPPAPSEVRTPPPAMTELVTRRYEERGMK